MEEVLVLVIAVPQADLVVVVVKMVLQEMHLQFKDLLEQVEQIM